jgi:hypothetical protein
MLNIKKMAKRPKIFKTLCGLTPQQFNKLINKIEPIWNKAEYKRQNWKGRKRKIGGGRRKKLNLSQTLFMLLLYYRTYTNHIFIGMIAGIDDSNVGRYKNKLEPILSKIFKIPKKKINMSEDDILELIIDATEQESQKREGTGYSGKKKKQTIKTQICIDREGRIRAVSGSIAGNVHDKKLYDLSRTFTTEKTAKYADLGYLGTKCIIPIRKQKSRPLMLHEHYYNKKHAKKRIIVEHAFAHLKKFHILSDRFRNRANSYNLIFRNICGIRNFIIASS